MGAFSQPLSFVKARGATVMDPDGNVFIEMKGGTGVISVGHCNPLVVEAIQKQTAELMHAVDTPHPSKIELVSRLVSSAPGGSQI